jgi:hypothetical protein
MLRPRGSRPRRSVPIPKRPYLGSAILYAVLAGALVGVTWATGGGLVRALIVAAIFYVIATGWSWWKFHQQIEERSRAESGRGGE